jgi:hypothetical protein
MGVWLGGGQTYLAVLGSHKRVYICPYTRPVWVKVSVARNGTEFPDAVALVVFFAGLFCAEGEAAKHFLEGGGWFEHRGCLESNSTPWSAVSVMRLLCAMRLRLVGLVVPRDLRSSRGGERWAGASATSKKVDAKISKVDF